MNIFFETSQTLLVEGDNFLARSVRNCSVLRLIVNLSNLIGN